MGSKYAPDRRKLLALHQETSANETGLTVRVPRERSAGAQRQVALSVPESVRALGEPLEPFFEACGGRREISLSVIRRDGGMPPETSVFQQPFILIGRCPESDLPLPDSGTSFRHFYLQLTGGRWTFVDLSRFSGDTVDVAGPISGWFDADCSLTAGPYTITHVSVASQTATSSTAGLNADLPPFELELVNARHNSRFGRALKFSSSVTLIGASRQCDVWLKDDSVSTVHASLVLTSKGLWIVDLLGRDGVLVDNRPAYWRQVHEGSILQIGRFQFCVRLDATCDRSERRAAVRSADGDRWNRERGSSSGGSLSEEAVMALVRQVAEMQAQFFEHSQMQMQLISGMLAHLGQNQQVTVRQDLARIEEIGREVQDIKSQLSSPPKAAKASRSRKQASRRQKTGRRRTEKRPPEIAATEGPIDQTSVEEPATVSKSAEGETGPLAPDPPPSNAAPENSKVLSETVSESAESSQAETYPTVNYHAQLTQRLAALSQERTSLWRHVLNVFAGKPDPPSEK